MSNLERKIKLLAPDLRELIDLHPAQARKLQKNALVEKIPSNSELILRLKSRVEQFIWPLDILPSELYDLIKRRLNSSNNDIRDTRIRPITLDNLADIFTKLEEKDERVLACVFTPKLYSDIRKFGREAIDLIQTSSITKYGFLSTLWSAAMMCRLDLFSKKHPNDHFYVISKNRKVVVDVTD